jgi:hypothetical protein
MQKRSFIIMASVTCSQEYQLFDSCKEGDLMMRIIRTLVFAAVALGAVFVLRFALPILTRPTQGDPGTLQTWETYCVEANKDKRIALDGFLALPSSMSVRDGKTSVQLKSLDQKMSISVDVVVDVHIEKPPIVYSEDSLKIKTVDGKTLGPKDQVRVSGVLQWSKSELGGEDTCWLRSPVRIEST